MSLFTTASKDTRVGVDFLAHGVAVAQVRAGRSNPGELLRAELIEASGQQAQIEALEKWVRANGLRKAHCFCLVAQDDCDLYHVERPDVEDAELIQAVTWKVKDLINYDVEDAVIDCYPMPESGINHPRQVAVVAAREAVIGAYVDAIRETSLRLEVLDIHVLARANLPAVRHGAGKSLVLLSFADGAGMLSVYHDTDLYVARELNIGIGKLEQAGGEDDSVYDTLLLEIQRSLDYLESFYGIGAANDLLVFPRHQATEKMARYLQNLTSFEIDFVTLGDHGAALDPACFHAYCAALRGLDS